MSAKSTSRVATLDGNEAAAYIAYRVNEVCAIYPITPSSTMAELADEWSAGGIKNIWGQVPQVIEMQSEGGAAGTVHGALQAGALTTTFTASQGLMLMLPNMYKIAGELTPAVFHVAARSLAAQGLSIFGDHSDVMAARMTGFALLASASVQEAHDQALIAQAATLRTRIPFIHFFDGFRTSHELNKIEMLSDEQIRSMIRDEWVHAHRQRALNPDNPFIRGTAQNPDVYFQARETVNPFYSRTPEVVQEVMDEFARVTGRRYKLFEYTGHKAPERLVVIMGSGSETAEQTVKRLVDMGEKVGVLKVRLFRPFSSAYFLAAIPDSVTSIAVLDRTKEPGAAGEPLYQDVVTALAEGLMRGDRTHMPRVTGGRYGLSSKEFTPGMVKAVFDELKREHPQSSFTIGITDDVTHRSLTWDEEFTIEPADETRAVFYGLGADGTVGANKNSIKIIGENTPLFAQGYFVYDSKKSGSRTVSHLRFGKLPIHAPYLISKANFVACHQFNFLEKTDVLELAAPGAVFLLNCPYPKEQAWARLPFSVQKTIVSRGLRLYVIDANAVAQSTGMDRRINTIMQTCFFAISGVLPREEAIAKIKEAIKKTYSGKGKKMVDQNFAAVDATLENLFEITVPETLATGSLTADTVLDAPAFVREVTALMMAGKGDALPVSKMPVDGTYPSGTTQYEKRNIAEFVPAWEEDLCIQCGNCAFVCPHSVIRSKFYHEGHLKNAPAGFKSAPISAKGFPETRYTLEIELEDCTGCTLCVEACPVRSTKVSGKRAINMVAKGDDLVREKKPHLAFFEKLPLNDRSKVDFSSVRGVQFLEPLFEFSGACAGCGETPYLKLLSQLFGDRSLIANATGCSSIYGGNLPTTPWTKNADGRGPAWANSLFEDNAEFGLGMRITADQHHALARALCQAVAPVVGERLIDEILNAPQLTESDILLQRARVSELKDRLTRLNQPVANDLLSVADHLVKRTVWLVGGDGWAYDIGSGGLDHVLASGRNVNVLVLDTEVYSNTGGQSSKATPAAATAKFAYAGKRLGKKDLAMQMISYGNVYVARVAMGANPQQTLLAFREAEAFQGPSIILAYSHCIAHGINMERGLDQQALAVASGYWPLIRYNPALRTAGNNPFVLDSPRPRIGLRDYAYNELRYKALLRTNPQEAEQLMDLAQEIVNLRWSTYEEMATRPAHRFEPAMLK